jgi:H/ACA ribonucleoprotein complex non-core subunit NAF1
MNSKHKQGRNKNGSRPPRRRHFYFLPFKMSGSQIPDDVLAALIAAGLDQPDPVEPAPAVSMVVEEEEEEGEEEEDDNEEEEEGEGEGGAESSNESESDTSSSSSSLSGVADMDADADEGDSSFRPPATKNELVDVVVPPVTVSLTPGTLLSPAGAVMAIVDLNVVVQAPPGSTALDIGSVLAFEDLTVLGAVFDTFGPVKQPHYSVRFNRPEDIDRDRVVVGRPVLFVPDHARFVLPAQLHQKGSDASAMFDEEPPEEEVEFSDDEAEAQAKAAKKKPKKKQQQQPQAPAAPRATQPPPSAQPPVRLQPAVRMGYTAPPPPPPPVYYAAPYTIPMGFSMPFMQQQHQQQQPQPQPQQPPNLEALVAEQARQIAELQAKLSKQQ